MSSPRSNFAALGLAPLILRIALGLTFVWSGLGKWYGTTQVKGDDAAFLASLDIIPPPQPAIPAPSATPSAPLPTSGGSKAQPAEFPPPAAPKSPAGSLLILAQATNTPPVTSGSAILTAADFPEPVTVRSTWNIALAVHHAAHRQPPAAGGPKPLALWPPMLAGGLWPKVFAIGVLIAELGGGALLLLGLFTRTSAFAIASVMLGAIWLTQIGPAMQSGHTLLGFLPDRDPWNPREWSSLAWQLSLLASALALACMGSGVLAIDRAISGYRAVPERFRARPEGPPRG